MLIKVGNFEFTEVWDGVFYKKLSDYPRISDWEIRNLIEFIEYEEQHGRLCEIECENSALLKDGCITEFVCHTSSAENAKKILNCGKLLSAVNARKQSAERLAEEKRNAANDPPDYFEYVMLGWGNCQAGDRLVTERKLGRFPDEHDLSERFTPGVRFYFKYTELVKHPDAVFDGVLPMKVKNEIVLRDWVYAIVIPTEERENLERAIPADLRDRVVYLENDCKDIWEWSEKVYNTIEKL